jgi:hypothetical protein
LDPRWFLAKGDRVLHEGGCEKIRTTGRAGISSKSYKRGFLEA